MNERKTGNISKREIVFLIAAILSIVATTVSIANYFRSLNMRQDIQKVENNASIVDRGLSVLREQVISLAYHIEIINPGCAPQKFGERKIHMEVNFGMDLTPNDFIWILGLDVANNKNYPLRELDMIRGQRYWRGTVNLPPNATYGEWILRIVKVGKDSARLFETREKSNMPVDVLPDDAWWLASKTIKYGK